jgi:hypothetical protein
MGQEVAKVWTKYKLISDSQSSFHACIFRGFIAFSGCAEAKGSTEGMTIQITSSHRRFGKAEV